MTFLIVIGIAVVLMWALIFIWIFASTPKDFRELERRNRAMELMREWKGEHK